MSGGQANGRAVKRACEHLLSLDWTATHVRQMLDTLLEELAKAGFVPDVGEPSLKVSTGSQLSTFHGLQTVHDPITGARMYAGAHLQVAHKGDMFGAFLAYLDLSKGDQKLSGVSAPAPDYLARRGVYSAPETPAREVTDDLFAQLLGNVQHLANVVSRVDDTAGDTTIARRQARVVVADLQDLLTP